MVTMARLIPSTLGRSTHGAGHVSLIGRTSLEQLRGRDVATKAGIRPKARPSRVSVSARINIDRRMHLERAFERQLEAERQRALMAVSCPMECVREVRSLADLEQELEAAEAAGELVVVDFYNAACGACKDMLPYLITLCKTGALDSCIVDLNEAAPSLDAIPARFLKHNICDDYDDLTDIARMYRIKIVPTFAFFQDGSRIGQLVTRDSRKVASSLAKIMQERMQRHNEQ